MLTTLYKVNRLIDAAEKIYKEDKYYIAQLTVYTEGDFEKDVCVVGDWNHINKRLAQALEKAGADLDWEDCVCSCSDCGYLISTNPDSYSWQPNFSLYECEILCKACTLSSNDYYIENAINNPKKCLVHELLDEEFYNQWTKIEPDYYSGWHSGMDACPEVILEELNKQYEHVVFVLAENSQFYVKFETWVKKMNYADKLKELEHNLTEKIKELETRIKQLENQNKETFQLRNSIWDSQDYIEW